MNETIEKFELLRKLAQEATDLVDGAWIVPPSDIAKLCAATLRMTDYLDAMRTELAELKTDHAAMRTELASARESHAFLFENSVAKSVYDLLKADQQWVSVEERLPDPNKQVLILWHWDNADTEFYGISYRFADEDTIHTDDGDFDKTVVYWMPLPPPPVQP